MEKFWLLLKEPHKGESSTPPLSLRITRISDGDEIGIGLFRAVNVAEVGTFRVLLVKTFEGVAVKDADGLASEGGS